MRGQTSTEFIILLSVITIVLASVVFLLIQRPTGVFEQQFIEDYWQGLDVSVSGVAANGTHMFVIVTNNHDFAIQLNKIIIDNTTADQNQSRIESGQSVNRIFEYYWNESRLGNVFESDIDLEYIQANQATTYRIDGQVNIQGSLGILNGTASCGNGILEGDEVCDTKQQNECTDITGYFQDDYVFDGVTCFVDGACNSECNDCVIFDVCEELGV